MVLGLVTLSISTPVFAQDEVSILHPDVETMFQEANRQMLNEDYSSAIHLYEKVLSVRESATLNHNLGVAHYLDGNTGMSVLYFERCLRMGFGSADSREILSLVRNSEGIALPRYTLLQRLARSMPEWIWMLLLMGSFWGMLFFGGYVYLLVSRKSMFRDIAFVCLCLCIFSVIGCIGLSNDAEYGVLLGGENGLKIVPTSESEVFLELKAGEVARYLKSNNDYVFLETSGGVRGWLPKEQFGWIRSQ